MKRSGLVIASLLVLTSLILMIIIYFDLVDVGFVVGSYRFHHWSVILGSFYVAAVTPFFSLLKRSKPNNLKTIFRIHVFGNLLAFLLVSVHFAGQLSRPLEFYPDLGSGIGLYATLGLLVFTGFFLRFGLVAGSLRRFLKLFHVVAVLFFYLFIVIHALHGFGFI